MALTVLAIGYLDALENPNYQKWVKRAFSITFLTTSMVFWGALLAVWTPSVPIYRERAEVNLFKFLSEKVSDRDVVLAAYSTSNALPAWVPAKTLIGHGPESINLKSVQQKVAKFFRVEVNEMYRREIIEEFDIKYVVWGPQEKIIGKYILRNDPVLEEIYNSDDYCVFEVNLGKK